MAKKQNKNIKKKLALAALNLLKLKSWSKISIKEIFRKAKVKQIDAFSEAKEKKDILYLINYYFDEEIIKQISNNEGLNKHDKIFESLMLRFEIYNNHRKAVINLFNYVIKNSDLIFFILPLIIKSLNVVLESSDISSDGIIGKLKIDGLLIVFITVFLVWKDDKTSNLEKTMVALDRNLNRAEVIVNLINKKSNK